MRRKKNTHPSRQARGCATQKRSPIVTQEDEALHIVLLIALFLFCLLVLPHLMYAYIAPLKGWI